MNRFVAGMIVGATVVAASVFAFVATAGTPKPEPAFVPLLQLKLQDAERERDKLRQRNEWLEAESAAWKRLAHMHGENP